MSDYQSPADAITERIPVVKGSPQPSKPPSSRRRLPMPSLSPVALAVIGAVLIVAVGAGVVLLGAGPHHRATAAKASPSPSLQALPDFAGARSPMSGRITDHAAGLSYGRMGGQWAQGRDARGLLEALGSSSRTVMKAGSAEYASAPLQVGMGDQISGAIALNVAEEVIRSAHYPANPQLTPYAPEVLPAGEGWLAGFQVGPSQGDWEVVIAAVFPTGVGRPGVVVVTVPKSRRSLLPDIRSLFASVRPEVKPVGRANRM